FAATANCIVFQGGRPVFADVDPDTLLLDPAQVEAKITPRTKAIIAVDYTGHPCDYDALRAIADRHDLILVADACHSLGARYRGRPVGSLADMTVFSFHPVKHIATGEGGMVVTDRADWARRLRMFRNHGITTDYREREKSGSWFYEMVELGFKYRLTDIQCALGLSQMGKLPAWLRRRREIAAAYRSAFAALAGIQPLAVRPEVEHAYHLFVVRLGRKLDRGEVFRHLRRRGIGVNVHYIPVHLHAFYRKRLGTRPGECPAAEAAYGQIISLPMFAGLTNDDLSRVIAAVEEVVT
ncbi:MAG TPA: DegT/DnrJ/EryC1/StrS family aminotransferase, partial [Kiritimatiellae bacterium]|nr:DegT/DnrJ/EryC1/StrS family aminotransferase [Kiritimatiellia bacterium]